MLTLFTFVLDELLDALEVTNLGSTICEDDFKINSTAFADDLVLR